MAQIFKVKVGAKTSLLCEQNLIFPKLLEYIMMWWEGVDDEICFDLSDAENTPESRQTVAILSDILEDWGINYKIN